MKFHVHECMTGLNFFYCDRKVEFHRGTREFTLDLYEDGEEIEIEKLAANLEELAAWLRAIDRQAMEEETLYIEIYR